MQRAPQHRSGSTTEIELPASFLWGATVSAHAHEGGDDGSDWTHWEQRPGRIADGTDSLAGVDHWHRFEQDFDLAAQLGLNALQVSVSWGRIAPDEHRVDATALSHYALVFAALRERGIEPLCVLHEHAAPAWFARRGGWAWRGAPETFAAYARHVADAVGQVCRLWLPVYEPEHWLTMVFRNRAWPGASGLFLGETTARQNLLEAHAAAAAILRALGPKHRVGFSVRGTVCAPEDLDSPWDLRKARSEHARRNHAMLRHVARDKTADFVGLSYYGREQVRFSPMSSPPLHSVSRMLRGIAAPGPALSEPHATGLHDLIAEFSEYSLPIMITGNGLTTGHDDERCDFLLNHLHFMVHSIQNGMAVQGYFHWSLIDGFTWRAGYAARTGLVHVDHESLARTPNKSAFLYRDISRARSLSAGIAARYRPGWAPPEKEKS